MLRHAEVDRLAADREVVGPFAFAVEEDHHVGVLLDGAGLTEVREARFALLAHLGLSRELADRDERDGELARECLQAARDLGDLLHAVPLSALLARLHQLQVVDDQQVEFVFHLEAACLGAELHHRDARRVVDEHLRLGERAHGVGDLGEVHVRDVPAAQVERIDLRDAGEEAQHELLLAHLEREDADRLALAHRNVLGDVQRERCLADRRSRGEDDQVGLLQPLGDLVDIRVAGPQAHQLSAVLVHAIELLVCFAEQVADRGEPVDGAPFADSEEFGLGAVDRLGDVGGILVADRGDATGGADQAPQHRLSLDDLRVLLGVDGGRRSIAEVGECGASADLFDLTAWSDSALEDFNGYC